jgi:hypothetical protein
MCVYNKQLSVSFYKLAITQKVSPHHLKPVNGVDRLFDDNRLKKVSREKDEREKEVGNPGSLFHRDIYILSCM